jgi:hypothetical protein
MRGFVGLAGAGVAGLQPDELAMGWGLMPKNEGLRPKTSPHRPPRRLQIEILGTAALPDVSKAAKIIEECQALEAGSACFQDRLSSLSYLPVEPLRIDPTFVRGMLESAGACPGAAGDALRNRPRLWQRPSAARLRVRRMA